MKSIRFYSILVFFLFTLVGCSSDDDGGGPTGPTVSNQIFATWKLSFFVEDGEVFTEFPCDSDLQYNFNSNRNYTKTIFAESEDGNTCDVSIVISGRWEILEDNVLKLTPSSSAFNPETVTLKILNNNQQLEMRKSSNLTQIFSRL